MPFKDRAEANEYSRQKYWIRRGLVPPPKREKKEGSHKTRAIAWYVEYKRGLACIDCGFSFREYPEVCEFHHRDPSTKETGNGGMSKFAKNGAMDRLKDEIAKCDALCANCHRIRHAKERKNILS